MRSGCRPSPDRCQGADPPGKRNSGESKSGENTPSLQSSTAGRAENDVKAPKICPDDPHFPSVNAQMPTLIEASVVPFRHVVIVPAKPFFMCGLIGYLRRNSK